MTYLKTNPSSEFIKSEYNRLNRILSDKQNQFKQYSHNNYNGDHKKIRAQFNKDFEIPKLKTQVNNLRIILEL